MKAEEIYKELKGIVYPINEHSEQLLAISHWFENELKENAEKYHLEQLRRKYKPSFCKGCKYWTVIDALGGEYCKVLQKSVASPRDNFKHQDCPL